MFIFTCNFALMTYTCTCIYFSILPFKVQFQDMAQQNNLFLQGQGLRRVHKNSNEPVSFSVQTESVTSKSTCSYDPLNAGELNQTKKKP